MFAFFFDDLGDGLGALALHLHNLMRLADVSSVVIITSHGFTTLHIRSDVMTLPDSNCVTSQL